MKKMKFKKGWNGKTIKIMVWLMVILALLIFPFIVFWAIDTLFHYRIPYGIMEIIAFWVLFFVLRWRLKSG